MQYAVQAKFLHQDPCIFRIRGSSAIIEKWPWNQPWNQNQQKASCVCKNSYIINFLCSKTSPVMDCAGIPPYSTSWIFFLVGINLESCFLTIYSTTILFLEKGLHRSTLLHIHTETIHAKRTAHTQSHIVELRPLVGLNESILGKT